MIRVFPFLYQEPQIVSPAISVSNDRCTENNHAESTDVECVPQPNNVVRFNSPLVDSDYCHWSAADVGRLSFSAIVDSLLNVYVACPTH